MTPRIFKSRIECLKKNINDGEAILLANPSDIHYFTNFGFLLPEEREAFLLVTSRKNYLIHASFSPLPSAENLTFLPRCGPGSLRSHLENILKETSFSTLHSDLESIYAHEYLVLKSIKNLNIKPFQKKHIWSLRSQKDESEKKALKEAGRIASLTYREVRSQIKSGQTEKEVSDLIEATMKRNGSNKPAFPTIVAFGEHIALPHHQPSNKILQPETPILIDFGASYLNYRSDISRTFWLGEKPLPQFLEIEALVMNAYQGATDLIKNYFNLEELTNDELVVKTNNPDSQEEKNKQPLIIKEIDALARKIISDAGYGANFNHTLGHGVGLEIHEEPSVSWANNNPLLPNMTITIEPGIYLEGKMGYRYENTVFVS